MKGLIMRFLNRFLIMILLALVGVVVWAQEYNTPTPACSDAELALVDRLTRELTSTAMTLQEDGSAQAIDKLQFSFWLDYYPTFPNCAAGQSQAMWLGIRLDSMLITTLYDRAGDQERAGNQFLILPAGPDLRFAEVTDELFELARSPDAKHEFSGWGEGLKTIGLIQLTAGEYDVKLTTNVVTSSLVTVVIRNISGQESHTLPNDIRDVGIYSDRYDMMLTTGGHYIIEVLSIGTEKWALTLQRKT